jgi:predicted nucleic acid-binding protein
MNVEFIDTNVLVYVFENSAGSKHEIASELFSRVMEERVGAISIQVLEEFYVVTTRKLPRPFPENETLEILKQLSSWRIFSPHYGDVIEAIAVCRRHHISLWDAMIVQAAVKTNASVIWTEDLNNGQVIEGVRVKNPFARLL